MPTPLRATRAAISGLSAAAPAAATTGTPAGQAGQHATPSGVGDEHGRPRENGREVDQVHDAGVGRWRDADLGPAAASSGRNDVHLEVGQAQERRLDQLGGVARRAFLE